MKFNRLDVFDLIECIFVEYSNRVELIMVFSIGVWFIIMRLFVLMLVEVLRWIFNKLVEVKCKLFLIWCWVKVFVGNSYL